MSEQEKAENCYRLLYRSMIEKDRAILTEILDDTFVLVHMTGMRQPKAAFIRAVEDGTLNYFSAEHQSIEVEIQDDTAQLIGQSVVSAAVFGGGRHTWRLRLDLNLSRKANGWSITKAQAFTY